MQRLSLSDTDSAARLRRIEQERMISPLIPFIVSQRMSEKEGEKDSNGSWATFASARPFFLSLFGPFLLCFSMYTRTCAYLEFIFDKSKEGTWHACFDVFAAVSLKPTSMLKRDFPQNLRLLSLYDNSAFDGDRKAILRLAHLFEAREDPELSQPASVDITDLFSSFTLANCTEMQLSAVLPLDQGRFHEHINT